MPLERILRRSSQALLTSLTSHRILLYSTLSIFALLAVVANALKNHSNFYSVAIYLSKSSRSVLVLANFTFLLALLGGHIVQRIFFGSLRPNEVERLYDRLWFFITESLLAFTIFRDEFDIPFALMFGFLLFVKSFHWLASDRIEWMDQRPYPGPPLLFHVRMSVLFSVLWMTDLLMFLIAVESTLNNGIGGMVLFASEYGILMASVTNTIAKYLLSAYDFRRAGQRGGENAPPWENKSMWVFYIELATDFLKLTTYLVFFTIIITFYGLPLNIVRDVYITARSFITRLRALHRYQTATRNMDQRYPDASEEEMAAMSDRTCIICREEMILLRPAADVPQAPVEGPNMTPKKLPCGHIFHFHCLRSWLERQQSCPTCRRTVLDNAPQGQQPTDRQAAGPPPPQGVAPPAQQNPLAGLGAQNVNGQGGNNFLGLVGRLFGVQAPPPVPGPLAPAQVLQNFGNAAGQPGVVVVRYNIQYQLQNRAQGHPQDLPQNQQQQPLQPVHQFEGFLGPGEIWQPWPRNHDEPGQEPDRPPSDARQSPGSLGAHSSEESPSGESTVPASPATAADSSLSPREAAALAAARRMGSSGHVQQGPSSSSSITPSNTNSTSSGTPTSSHANESSQSQTSPSRPDETFQRLDIPVLIPLFEYDVQSSSVGDQPSIAPATHTLPQPTQSPDAASNSHLEPRSSTPIPPLPPTLTDEQLALMDRVTREAIDERLRVLENVSMAAYRCIDDLMRMRSALPSPGSAQTHTSSVTEKETETEGTAGEERNEGSVNAGSDIQGTSTQ